MGIKLNGISWEYTESGQKGIQQMFYYLELTRKRWKIRNGVKNQR